MLSTTRIGPILVASFALATRARAAGLEDTVGGAIGLGRAAHFARVNDFLATWQNPANLAVVPGAELGAELRISWLQACYDRAYDETVATVYRRPDPTLNFRGTESVASVCNEGPPGPGGNFGWAQSLSAGWGYGIGFFTPAAGAVQTKWGNDTIVSLLPRNDEQYPPTLEGVEPSTRQMGIERKGRFGGFLMAGIGWAPSAKLRLGASAGVGALSFMVKSVASASQDTFLDQEVLQEATVSDYVIPRATASFVLSPLKGVEIFGVLTYQGDFHGNGHIVVTANGIKGEPLADCLGKDPGTHCRLDGVQIDIPLPTLEVTYGMRYAKRHAASTRTLDPLRDEVWDLEVDANWAQTSNMDAVRVTLYDDSSTASEDQPRVQLSSSKSPDVDTFKFAPRASAPLRWRDTWTVRVGGDYNVLRERLALRAGFSYATRAVPTEYMSIQYWPVRKIGLHFGLTSAFGRYRVSLAYAHLFYESINVPVGSGKLNESGGLSAGMPLAINEGYYQAALDVVSLQLGTSF